MHTETELFQIATDLGLSEDCAKEMVAEHLARQNETLPRYVRAALNSALVGARIGCVKTRRFLDRRFGWNAENVHGIFGLYVNRNLVGDWHVA